MKKIEFIKKPKAGQKIKVYMNRGKEPQYGIVRGVETMEMMDEANKTPYLQDMVLVERIFEKEVSEEGEEFIVNKKWELWETNFYYLNNKVIFVNTDLTRCQGVEFY
jgi:hypothetical protein